MLFETRPALQFHTSLCHRLPVESLPARPMVSLDDELTLLSLVPGAPPRAVFRWDLGAQALSWSRNLGDVWPSLSGKQMSNESHWLSLIHPEDRPGFVELKTSLAKCPERFVFEYRIAPGNGEIYRVRQVGSASWRGGAVHVIGIIEPAQNASAPAATPAPQVRMNEAVLLRHAYSYPEAFVERLNRLIAANDGAPHGGALVLLHLNNLPIVINHCGHHPAEALVEGMLARVRDSLPEADLVERVARDQFAIVLRDASPQIVHQLAGKLQRTVERYGTEHADGLIHVTSQVASVDFPGAAKNAVDALDKAHMVLASPGPARFRTFDDVKAELIQSRQNMGLANYLRRAIEENRLLLAFQPIIESATGGVAHYEALLRVIDEDGRINSAGPLIPVAEAVGMIEMIDTLVLHMVIEELKRTPDISIAFNVSNLTTDNPQWLEMFQEAVKPYPDITPRMIVEITETAAQQDLRRAAFFVATLQATGALVALDDFGSGHTSFRQLKALSVDMVKIDGAFVKDLVDNAENRYFIKTLLGFTSNMGLKTVAEFVESGEIAKILIELGVEYMQGYYFGKPDTNATWRTS